MIGLWGFIPGLGWGLLGWTALHPVPRVVSFGPFLDFDILTYHLPFTAEVLDSDISWSGHFDCWMELGVGAVDRNAGWWGKYKMWKFRSAE
jgi:hypothetical protein